MYNELLTKEADLGMHVDAFLHPWVTTWDKNHTVHIKKRYASICVESDRHNLLQNQSTSSDEYSRHDTFS